MKTVRTIPRTDISPGRPPVAALDTALALHVPQWLDRATCEQYVRGVYAGRERWVADFDAQQFTLGRAWYTHLEQGRSGAYFAHAADADADMAHFVPGLQETVIAAASALFGASVVRRPRWCGPGVHVFPGGSEVAREGGSVHFDIEGLTPAQCQQRVPTYTLVLMLQPPAANGGLKVWDLLYGEGDECDPGDDVAHALLTYQTGDLVLLDGYRLHQIQPFDGDVDRISATAHLVRAANQWEIWF